VQKNANIKLRILEEKYKQDREEIMKGLYADEIEINDSCIEIIDEIYNEIPKESRVKNTTSMRQLLLRIWAEQANCFYISSWNERAIFGKFTKIPWAVSGRRYTRAVASSVVHWLVESIKLNLFTSPQFLDLQFGQAIVH
jgi:hypothetical protein